jgi:hypothetical protein
MADLLRNEAASQGLVINLIKEDNLAEKMRKW